WSPAPPREPPGAAAPRSGHSPRHVRSHRSVATHMAGRANGCERTYATGWRSSRSRCSPPAQSPLSCSCCFALSA
ncbi:MAG: hypothetical protein AVDCRST_MAG21-1947, partial [uncultured Nocardioidaceae bacterium]